MSSSESDDESESESEYESDDDKANHHSDTAFQLNRNHPPTEKTPGTGRGRVSILESKVSGMYRPNPGKSTPVYTPA